ncbi:MULTISPECIES: TetR/AcrR family transcriptional regulator [unclassified Geodermatophilus]|uniref:TetR/AcrR family transcriptional regulator n=1 Tax=unclassified Geodermatophilus TaxID=2637632 RepID=UPI003EEDD924
MPSHDRPLRADAQRNRDAIVAAARDVMGRRGLDAPLDEIAQTAGVGNATVYRHFPTRQGLVQAVFADGMRRYASAAERAMEVDDPWTAVRGYLTEICALQAEHRALADLVTSREYVDATRSVAVARLRQLLARAQAAGVLRPDLTVDDVALVLMANAGVVRQLPERAVEASDRLVALLLDGLRAPDASSGAPPPEPEGPRRPPAASS